MLGRFTPFSPALKPQVQFTGSPDNTKKKHVPAPIATSEIQTEAAADEYIARRDQALADDAKRSKTEGASQADVNEAIRKSGSGKMSGSLVREIERNSSTSETQLFIKDVKSYLPILMAQANDPNHPDHEYAKNFVRDFLRTSPSPKAPTTTAGETLQPTTYQADSASSKKA